MTLPYKVRDLPPDGKQNAEKGRRKPDASRQEGGVSG
jgi:hypothetical protein